MLQHTNIFRLGAGLIMSACALAGCQKIEKGFLSDSIYYVENPFVVQQGITATSATLVADGSTNPLRVQLLGIRDKKTGASADSMFLKPQLMSTYLSAITYTDSTLALLKAKLKDSLVAPFSVNSIGGRLQFTQTTKFVDPGTYTIDVGVSNIKGEKILRDACDIYIIPATTDDTLTYKSWTTMDDAGVFYTPATNLQMDIVRVGQGPSKIIFRWKDKNGVFFNPAKGEVNPRAGRPYFAHWDPYYPEVRTDSTIEYAYPEGVPEFPVFPATSIGYDNGICYYQVHKNAADIGQYINTVSSIKYYTTRGTYIITYYLTNAARKK